MIDYYKVLSLPSSATANELRRAYRILARRYHPDLNPGTANADRFKEIAEAYEVLSDPERRKLYDLERQDVLSERLSHAYKAYSDARAKYGPDLGRRSRNAVPGATHGPAAERRAQARPAG